MLFYFNVESMQGVVPRRHGCRGGLVWDFDSQIHARGGTFRGGPREEARHWRGVELFG